MQRIDLQRAAQGNRRDEMQSHEMTVDGIDRDALQRCAGDRSTHRGLRSAHVGMLEAVRRHDPSRGHGSVAGGCRYKARVQ
jgi:hypothetical protein